MLPWFLLPYTGISVTAIGNLWLVWDQSLWSCALEQAESLRIGARSQNVDHHFSCLALYSFRIHSQIDEQDKTETLAFTGSSRSDVEGGIGVFCLFCNNYYQYLKFKPQELIAEIKLSLQQSLFRTWSKSNQFGGLIKRHHMFHWQPLA